MTKLGKKNEERIVVYADGLCEPCNPGGVACYGFVIKTGQEVLVRGKGVVCEGRGATNNVAEYSAAQAALDWLIEQGLTKEQIEVCSDSQLLIRQMTGEYQVSSERIIPLYNRLERTSARFKRLRWTWVPREKNQEADLLSREAYYEHISRKKARGLKVEMDDDGRLRVLSSKGVEWYVVDLENWSCSCPLATKRGIKPCKHVIAARDWLTEPCERKPTASTVG